MKKRTVNTMIKKIIAAIVGTMYLLVFILRLVGGIVAVFALILLLLWLCF